MHGGFSEYSMAAHAWRGDVATAGVAASPISLISDGLRDIPEIEQAYVSQEGDRSLSVLLVVNENDFDIHRRIFEREREIIRVLVGIEIGFRLVVRQGRPLREILRPHGNLLFTRE